MNCLAPSRRLDAAGFAKAIGRDVRTAQLAFKAGHYRGVRLPLVPVSGRGGNGGQRWELDLAAVSPELVAAVPALAELRGDVEGPSKVLPGPVEAEHFSRRQEEVAQERYKLIAPVLRTGKGSAERAEMIAKIAEAQRLLGRKGSESSLRAWLRAFEGDGGLVGLKRQARADAGAPKVLVSREFDAAELDIADDVRARIVAYVEKRGRGWVQAWGRSQVETAKMCSDWLAQELRRAGATLPEAELERVCRVPVHWVRRWYAEALTVWQASQRHGQWSDTGVARLTRTPPARPFAEVELDGHFLDHELPGKRHAVAVTALDRASGYLWAHLFIRDVRGLTQRHAATALERFFCRPGGCGVPGVLIPDQGSEFKNLGFGMGELKKLAQAQGLDFAVRPAAPRSPQGKGRLEQRHDGLEDKLALLPGHPGGDWWNDALKAPGVGIDPYAEGEAAFEEAFYKAVDAYNNTRPAPGKPSPRERLEALCRETGTAARIIDRAALDGCFCEEKILDQVSGTVEVDGRKIGLDWLCDHPGLKKVTVRKPLRFVPEGELLRAWAVHGGRLHELHEERVETMDPAGVRRIEAVREKQTAALAEIAAKGAEPEDALEDYIATLPSTGPAAIPVATWTLTPPAEELPDPEELSAEDAAEAEDDPELRRNFDKNTYGAGAYRTTPLATACGE